MPRIMKNRKHPMEPKKMEPTTICLMVLPREIRATKSPMLGAKTSHHAQ